LVTGYRDLAYQESYKEFMYPYGQLFTLSPQFAESNSLLWLLVVSLLVVVFIMMKAYDYLRYLIRDNSNIEKEEEQVGINLDTKMLYFYSFLVFPIVVFNFIMTTFTLFINSNRFDVNGAFL